ncbi:PAS domain S-box protein [Scytonema sp. UIC 10036]|uniref:ATP-binding protein n=1 Tax=Scytonema sp. UIC 10036 TaxID=2304196 RepID=UPI0012DA658F|nr:ATP-binding protein [Scytonema sp. UIC 10036]MUG99884.1 PAS domain S-box protein [Scytonema sp. UIC 10036]
MTRLPMTNDDFQNKTNVFMKFSIKKNLLTGGFLSALLLLSSVGIASYISIIKLLKNQHWVEHTHEVLDTIEFMKMGLLDAERGRRGYIITGDISYLNTYEIGVSNTQKMLRKLFMLTLYNNKQQQKLEAIQPLIKKKEQSLKKSIEVYKTQKANREIQIKFTNQGRDLQHQIQAKIDELEKAERVLLSQRSQATNRSVRYITIIIGIGYFLSFSLLSSVWFLLQKQIDKRRQVEAILRQTNHRLKDELKERQLAEALLQESEEKFRSLCERSPVCIFMLNEEGNFTYVNPQCQMIFSDECDKAIGKNWLQLIHEEEQDRVTQNWLQALFKQEGFSDEVPFPHPEGKISWGRIWTSPIFSTKRKFLGCVGIIEDITASHAIAQLKNEFLSIASHELRTPLSSIRGALGLLATGVLQNQPETAKQMIEIASNDAERLVRLVNDMLDFQRLQSNKIILRKQWCSADNLVKEIINSLESLAAEKQITLLFSPNNVQIWANPDRIIQTLVNLVSNAIKFSLTNSTVTIVIIKQTDKVLFQVKDQGPGIPTEHLETIFDKFHQVDASDSRQEGATGLGLAICKSIVQQHGGEIWVESVVGKGSTFYFTLPLPLDR